MKANLGCGWNHKKGYVNCDIDKDVNPDLCFDMEHKFLFKDNSVDEVYCRHTLEHIDQDTLIRNTIPEIIRICKPEAKVIIIVPYMDSQLSLDHKTRFNEDTFNGWFDSYGLRIESVSYGIRKFHRPIFWIPTRAWRHLWEHLIAEIRVTMRVCK